MEISPADRKQFIDMLIAVLNHYDAGYDESLVKVANRRSTSKTYCDHEDYLEARI